MSNLRLIVLGESGFCMLCLVDLSKDIGLVHGVREHVYSASLLGTVKVKDADKFSVGISGSSVCHYYDQMTKFCHYFYYDIVMTKYYFTVFIQPLCCKGHKLLLVLLVSGKLVTSKLILDRGAAKGKGV